jgi:hypothetical protein
VELTLDAPYDWMIAEGLDDDLRSEVIDALHHVASVAMAAGDQFLAEQTLEVGRRIEPASELLARDLLVLLSDAARHDEADARFAELERELAQLGGNEPSAVTRALWRELSRSRRGARGH